MRKPASGGERQVGVDGGRFVTCSLRRNIDGAEKWCNKSTTTREILILYLTVTPCMEKTRPHSNSKEHAPRKWLPFLKRLQSIHRLEITRYAPFSRVLSPQKVRVQFSRGLWLGRRHVRIYIDCFGCFCLFDCLLVDFVGVFRWRIPSGISF